MPLFTRALTSTRRFSAACCCLVRRRRAVFAHRARFHDPPHWHPALVDQISDHRPSAFFAQLGVHGSASGGVSIAHHLDDVSLEVGCGLRQLFEFFFVLRRDRSATDFEFHSRFALHVIFTQRHEAISVLLDVKQSIPLQYPTQILPSLRFSTSAGLCTSTLPLRMKWQHTKGLLAVRTPQHS